MNENTLNNSLNNLFNRRFIVQPLAIKRYVSYDKYTTIVHTPKGDEKRLKPEYLKKIQQRLENEK